MNALGRVVHLLPASELVWQGYPSTPIAICGERVTSSPETEEEDAEEQPRYCRDCVRAAVQWSDWPGPGEHHD